MQRQKPTWQGLSAKHQKQKQSSYVLCVRRFTVVLKPHWWLLQTAILFTYVCFLQTCNVVNVFSFVGSGVLLIDIVCAHMYVLNHKKLACATPRLNPTVCHTELLSDFVFFVSILSLSYGLSSGLLSLCNIVCYSEAERKEEAKKRLEKCVTP